MFFNQINLVGRTANVRKTEDKNGDTVIQFNLAVNRPYKNEDGERPVDWVPVRVFGEFANSMSEYIGEKSRLLMVSGELQVSQYTQTHTVELEDGTEIDIEVPATFTQVRAEQIRFMDSNGEATNSGPRKARVKGTANKPVKKVAMSGGETKKVVNGVPF